MIEFRKISKVFKTDLLKKPFVALEDVSFTIPEGKIIGFLGANGAGKTTSIKMAMDFIRPTSGEIIYGPSLGGSRSNALKTIGYLPERPFFYPHLTGREFCSYMGKLSDLTSTEINTQVLKWAPRFKIDFALDREIKTYSKGMLQRVGFLATLLHDPSLIILDEPLSGVDPIGRKELKDVIVELNQMGKTIFFSSHIVSDMEEICDTVICLRDGKVAFQGSVDQLISENIKPQFYVKYMVDGVLQTKEIEASKKMECIKSLANEGFDIVSVEQDKPSLEQIFYKVK
jgi:ABC-2 type transport system ATP-binding protein